MEKFDGDSARLATSGGDITLTPVQSEPFEQDARVSFRSSNIQGEFGVQYLNGAEFADQLQTAHANLDGSAELLGHPGFSVLISVAKNGGCDLKLQAEPCRDDESKVSFSLKLDQSYLPEFLSQFSKFNRSSAYCR